MFPPVDEADDDGFLCYGGELEPQTLTLAYSQGIFPWPEPDLPPLWFAPPTRTLLFFDEFHVSRSVRKLLREDWEVRFDTSFPAIIKACAKKREGQRGTWITPEMRRAYTQLHAQNVAHCVETWRNGELVGGLYGVSWGRYFAGESMFFRESGASKVALCALVEHLRARGATWLDCQTMTPLFASFGAREVPRNEFIRLLGEAWNAEAMIWMRS